MTTHVCERCGHEDPCSYGNWADRHPIIAATAGLFTLVFMGMMFSVHPVASAVMVVLALSWVGVRAIGRERRRRSALVARADYEHAQLQLREEIRAAMPSPTKVRPLPRRPVDRYTMIQTAPTRPLLRR